MPLILGPSLLTPILPTMTMCSFCCLCSNLRISSVHYVYDNSWLGYGIISGWVQDFQSWGFSDSPINHNYSVMAFLNWPEIASQDLIFH